MALPGERGISGRPSGGDSHRSAQDMVRRPLSPAVRVEYVNELVHKGGGGGGGGGPTIILCDNITPTQLLQKEKKGIHQ